MKTILFNLFVLATVILVSSAYPRDRHEDHQSLLNSDTSLENGENPLQKRRPPVKIPGPKVRNPENEEMTPDSDNSKMTQLLDEGKKKGKKDANLTKDNKHKMDDFSSLDDDSNRGKKGKGKDKDKDKDKDKEKDKDLVRRDENNRDEETQEERNSN